MDVIKLLPYYILFLYEKLNLCIDYIGRDDYSVVKDNINKISTEAIYHIENDPSLYFLKGNIEKNLITFRDKLTAGINPSSYTKDEIFFLQAKLYTFLDYVVNKTKELSIIKHVSEYDNHILNNENQLKDIKVDLYTLCWNEIDLLPFVIDYWKRFVRQAYVFDNGSTDGSIEFLQQFPWITVIQYNDTNDKIDDDFFKDIKNNAWKYSRGDADFVAVCDLDECLFSNDLEKELKYMIENEQYILRPAWYTMKSDRMFDRVEGKLLHQQMKTAHGEGGLDKAILFNPNFITEINYGAGCHVYCSKPENVKIYDKHNIFLLHFEKCFGVEYCINRKIQLKERTSKLNIEKGYAVHYRYPIERIRKDYIDFLNSTFDINEIIDKAI